MRGGTRRERQNDRSEQRPSTERAREDHRETEKIRKRNTDETTARSEPAARDERRADSLPPSLASHALLEHHHTKPRYSPRAGPGGRVREVSSDTR